MFREIILLIHSHQIPNVFANNANIDDFKQVDIKKHGLELLMLCYCKRLSFVFRSCIPKSN